MTDSQQTQNIGMNVFSSSQQLWSVNVVGQSALSQWRECVVVFANNMPALFAFFCNVRLISYLTFSQCSMKESQAQGCVAPFLFYFLFLQLFTPFVVIQHQDSDKFHFTVAGSCLVCGVNNEHFAPLSNSHHLSLPRSLDAQLK